MKATFTQTQYTGKIASNRKENNFTNQKTLFAIEKGELRELVMARFYVTQGRHYCCVWVHSAKANVWISGGAFAGGYGYHRGSQALESALDDAGVKLSEAIGGRGDTAIDDALKAVGVALGYKKAFIHSAHA